METLTNQKATRQYFDNLVQCHLLELDDDHFKPLEASQNYLAQSRYGISWLDLKQFCRDSAVIETRNTMQLSRSVEITPTEVWPFLVEPDNLIRWHIPTVMEFVVGGRFEFKNAWAGTIGAIEEDRLVRFDADEGGCTTFSVKRKDQGSQIVITDVMAPQFRITKELISNKKTIQENQPGGVGTHWSGVLSGWHCAIDELVNLMGVTNYPTKLTYSQMDSLYLDLLNDRFRTI